MDVSYKIKKCQCIEINGEIKTLDQMGYPDLDSFSSFLMFDSELIRVSKIENNRSYDGLVDICGKEISPCIYSEIIEYDDGFAIVVNIDREFNFINNKGELLFEKWLKYPIVKNFHDDCAIVYINDEKFNLIDKNGNLLSKKWLRLKQCYVEKFCNGYAKVVDKNGRINFIDKKGRILYKKWIKKYGRVHDFYDGCAIFERSLGSQKNFLNLNGQFISERWYNVAYNFYNGFAVVKRQDGKWNIIDKKGNPISEQWYRTKEELCAEFEMARKIVQQKDLQKSLYHNIAAWNLLSLKEQKSKIEANRNEMKSIIIDDKEYPIITGTQVEFELASEKFKYIFVGDDQEEKSQIIIDHLLQTTDEVNKIITASINNDNNEHQRGAYIKK